MKQPCLFLTSPPIFFSIKYWIRFTTEKATSSTGSSVVPFQLHLGGEPCGGVKRMVSIEECGSLTKSNPNTFIYFNAHFLVGGTDFGRIGRYDLVRGGVSRL